MKFIFEVRVKPGFTVEEYAQGWVEASEIIQQTPGARGTYLHRKIGEPDKVLAIAHWDSKANRDAMEGKPNPEIASIIKGASRYCDIRLIGEFEDPEWRVIPPAS